MPENTIFVRVTTYLKCCGKGGILKLNTAFLLQVSPFQVFIFPDRGSCWSFATCYRQASMYLFSFLEYQCSGSVTHFHLLGQKHLFTSSHVYVHANDSPDTDRHICFGPGYIHVRQLLHVELSSLIVLCKEID